MNRIVFALALALGLLTVGWVGLGFVGGHTLALLMTLVIACVYLLGAYELVRFRAATGALAAALTQTANAATEGLEAWLQRVPAPLRHTVRMRIEGERVALPGPTLTPYLVGLLVMLGMLGTFLGMVVTFQGAVFALEGSTDLQAIRSALAAPIKGLGLSFGTSVAGVASSAMLGLLSALSRRERVQAARQLDACVATVFRPFSLVHQRQVTWQALQAQTNALPAVVSSLQTLADGLERRHQQLGEQLLAQQTQFQHDVTAAYTGLAASVGQSLRESLNSSAQAAGDNIRPVVQEAMHVMAQTSAQTHQRQLDATHSQLDRLFSNFNTTLEQAQQQHVSRLDQHAERWRTEQASLRAEEAARSQAAVDRLGELQTALASQLATLGAALEAPMTRMLQTAAEVPQAAADVMVQLRQEMARLSERDNASLHERANVMGQINALLHTLQQASGQQQAAIESLVASASGVLQQASQGFAQTLEAQSRQAHDVASQVQASAIELASLGESFGHGVQLFSASNAQLTQSLQHLQASLQQSLARSDEQLAYYVAQAREVIDLSISAQQGIVEDLRRLHGNAPPPTARATQAPGGAG